jgi:hypothetical protein
MEKFFVRYSTVFGITGLGFALTDLGLSMTATVGFSVAFGSILSVLMAILSVLEIEKN